MGVRKRTAILIFAVLLFGCREDRQRVAQTSERERECSLYTPEEIEEFRVRDRQLNGLIAQRRADPKVEAAIAADRGDFRLFGYSRVVPGIFPAVVGFECRANLMLSNSQWFRGMYSPSDVPPRDEAQRRTRATYGKGYSTFARSYNLALFADSRFPWRDICRPEATPARSIFDGDVAPQNYGYRNLEETVVPIDTGEAARRGTTDSLERLAKANIGAINRPDPFGLTPLGWAVLYKRAEQVKTLIRYGASPVGAPCLGASQSYSPIQLARILRQRNIIEQMLPLMAPEAKQHLHDDPKHGPLPRNSFDFIKNYEGRLGSRRRIEILVNIDARGRPTECNLEPKTGIDELDRELCSVGLNKALWEPARDEFGEAMAGVGSLIVTFGDIPHL